MIKLPKEFHLFPALCGALLSTTFGMMMGWPSSANPQLLNETTSPILITMDDTALIAGFLLEGNSIGILLQLFHVNINLRLGIGFCLLVQIIGWTLMYRSSSVFWFLGSRLSIGFANGYGTGLLKKYFNRTCDANHAKLLNRYLPVCVSAGIVLMYIFGMFLNFRDVSLAAIAIPTFALLTFLLTAQDENIGSISELKQMNALECVKDAKTRRVLLLLFMLVFVQQYSGGPAHIVYAELIFTFLQNPLPKLSSIIFASFVLINSFVSIKYAKKFSKKHNLVISSVILIIILTSIALYINYDSELIAMCEYSAWLPLILLIFYNFFHTFSYNTCALLLLSELTPKQSLHIVGLFYNLHFSLSGVISTKLFQVLFTYYNLMTGYLFFLSILTLGLCLVTVIPRFIPKSEKDLPTKEVPNRF